MYSEFAEIGDLDRHGNGQMTMDTKKLKLCSIIIDNWVWLHQILTFQNICAYKTFILHIRIVIDRVQFKIIAMYGEFYIFEVRKDKGSV